MSDLKSGGERALDARAIEDFARSELFDRTFHEGMELVEETATYLDGGGRQESKLLSRSAALAYAAESMRLTTRLMQIASWLLVQRAVAEGELTAEQARTEHNKVKIGDPMPAPAEHVVAQLPERLRDLMAHSFRLQERIRHLEGQMSGVAPIRASMNPVLNQLACAGHTAKDFATNCKQLPGGGYDAVDPNGPRLYFDASDAAALQTALRSVAGSVCCGCVL